jgi:hypothetical protein
MLARTNVGCAEAGGVAEHMLYDVDWMANAVQVVIDATQYHWASKPRRTCDHLVAAEPDCAFDAAVQASGRIVAAHAATEGDAKKAAALLGMLPQIDADQGFRMERPGSLFEGFAHDGVYELLAAFDVPRGLVEHHAIADTLLDEQKLPVPLDDGGDGEVGSGHGGQYKGRFSGTL